MVKDLVTVLLPVFNQRMTLKESIDSVLNQSYGKLELIIVNDGSTDHPEEVIKEYNDPRLFYFNREHQGLPRTLNYALRQAKGEFITWTSGDNVMLPEMLNKMILELRKQPHSVAAYAGYYHIDAQGTVVGQNTKAPYIYEPEKFIHRPNREFLVTQFCNFGAAFLMRQTACHTVGDFDPECEGAEDVDYSIRIAKCGSVIYIPELLYKYRLHDSSMTGREKKGLVSYSPGRQRFWKKVWENSKK